MRKQLFVIILILLWVNTGSAQQKQSVGIDYIHSDAIVVDEWKSPGLYSPVNIFDGDINTTYAQRSGGGFRDTDADFTLTLRFNKSVYIDEIRIMNGFCKNNDLFKKNNRIKKMLIGFSPRESGKFENESEEESIILKDIKEFQSIKLSKAYGAKQIRLITEEIYKGTQYNDICITELEFYYKSQKVEINDVQQLKKNYVIKTGRDIIEAFSNRTYFFNTDSESDTVELFKDGSIKYHQSDSFGDPPVKEIMPDRWKVENSRLYMRIGDVWILYNYAIFESKKSIWNIQLFTNPYEYVSDDHPYKIYYKRLPDDYQFVMFIR